MVMCPIMILLIPGGRVQQNNGGNPMLVRIGSWVVLCGQDLIIAANPPRLDGRALIRILALWICAAFLKIIITTIKVAGVIKMYCR